MHIKYLILIIAILSPTSLFSQNLNEVNISGYVTDMVDGGGLEGITVKVINEADTTQWSSAVTDTSGRYELMLITDVQSVPASNIPAEFKLEQNYPNPFNPFTHLHFHLPRSSDVNLAIYNTLGQKVRTLVDRSLSPGVHSAMWDGRDDSGIGLAAGIYFYQLRAGDYVATKKMVLIDGTIGVGASMPTSLVQKNNQVSKSASLTVTFRATGPQIYSFEQKHVAISTPTFQYDIQAVAVTSSLLDRDQIVVSEPSAEGKVYVSGLAGAVIDTIVGTYAVAVTNHRTQEDVNLSVNIDGSFSLGSLVGNVGDQLSLTLLSPGQQQGKSEGFFVEDNVKPVVIKSKPTNGNKDIILDASVYIYFSEPIDPTTVTEDSYYLVGDGNNVNGTIDFLNDYTIASFTPDQPLEQNVDYTITVKNEVSDLQGNPLEDQFTVTFTTGSTTYGAVELIGRWPNGRCYTSFVVDNVAYVGNGGAMDIFDISNPSSPLLLGRAMIMGVVYDICVSGNYAYVANYEGSLHIIDVNNTSSPVNVGSIYTGSRTRKVNVLDNYAYVAASGGLLIIDVSTPSSITKVTRFHTVGFAEDVYVKDDFAYLANGMHGLRIIDVSTPSAFEVGFYDTDGTTRYVYVQDDYAYVVDNTGGPDRMHILDISTPSSPVLVGSFNTVNSARDIFVLDNRAYVTDYNAGLSIIDISTPSSPMTLGFFNTEGSARSVYTSDNYAYLACEDDGWHIIDVTVPSSPTEIGSFETAGFACGVYVLDNYAYIADNDIGLHILDVSNPSSPTHIGSFETGGETRNIHIMDNIAYLVCGEYGLRIIDVSIPSSPSEVGSFITGSSVVGVYIMDNYAYLAFGEDGLRIVDISTPSTPTEVGYLNTGNWIGGVYVVDNYAYVACGEDGLSIIDISTPSSPIEVGCVAWIWAQNIFVLDNFAYVTDYDMGMCVIDVSVPSLPSEVCSGYHWGGALGGVYVMDQNAYLTEWHGLHIIDVSAPSSPVEIGFFGTGEMGGNDVHVANNYIYVADGQDGLYILEYKPDISEYFSKRK